MKIPLATLASLYKQVGPVIPKNSPNGILDHALLQVKPGQIKLSGGDGNLHAEAWAESNQADSFSCCIPVKRLAHLVTLDGEADLSLKETALAVKVGRHKFNIQTIPAENYPVRSQKNYTADVDIPTLKYLLGRISFAMSFNDIRHYLNGSLFEFDGAKLHLVATDGHRIAVIATDCDAEPFSIIVPNNMVQVIERSQVTRFKADATEACFESDGFRVLGSAVQGRYPDWRRTMPNITESTTRCAVDRIALLDSINTIRPIIQLDQLNTTCLEATATEITLSARNREDAETSLPAAGQPFDIHLQGNFLADMVSHTSNDEIVLHQCGTGAYKSLYVEEGNWRTVAMALRG